ncbi:MAG TPA: hypothetical protein VIV11_33525 [Kofleriaceae bacterium]
MRNLVKTLLLISVVACSKGDAKQDPPKGSAATQPAPIDKSVAIFVDDQQVGKLALDQVNLWPRLDTLVPVSARRLGTWQTVTIKGAKAVDLQQPSATHPELVPAIFPGDGGAPAFGMFDPVELARHGKPALREDAITEVRIKLATGGMRGQNDHSEGSGSDPTKLVLTIKTAKGDHAIKGDKLLELPREAQPGEMGGDGKGWPLAKILEHADVKTYERLRLTGENNSNLTLEKQDLDPKTSVPFIKLNRQGSLRFRVFKKKGAIWEPGQDLRGLVAIEVLK